MVRTYELELGDRTITIEHGRMAAQAHAWPLATAATTTTHKPAVLTDRRNRTVRRFCCGAGAASMRSRIQYVPPPGDNEN